MSTKQELIFEINGLEVKTNSLYKIVDKFDPEAPSGFVEEGVTKLPSEGVGNTIQCNFVAHNPSIPDEGIWDTGLYAESPCYSDKDIDEVKTAVTKLKKFLITPYGKKYGKVNNLDHNDEKFWNNKRIFLSTGRVFNTSKIDDLLELYISMRSYSLTPKGLEGDHKFSDSDYVIIDNAKNSEHRKNQASDEMDAIISFGSLLGENRNKLIKVLFYSGLTVSEKMDDVTLKHTFKEHLQTSKLNADGFNKLVDQLGNQKVEEKVNMYKILNDLYKNGTSVTRRNNGRFYYKDIEIGESLKGAAENLIYSKDLSDLKLEIFSN